MSTLMGKIAVVTGASRGIALGLVAAELAEEYGFTDTEGRHPASIRGEILGIEPGD